MHCIDIHLSILIPYVCCWIIQIVKTPPGQKGRVIEIIMFINILVQFLPTHNKIINIWSSTLCISPPKLWVSIIDWNMIVGFQLIPLWNMKLFFFNNGNITKVYMTTTPCFYPIYLFPFILCILSLDDNWHSKFHFCQVHISNLDNQILKEYLINLLMESPILL